MPSALLKFTQGATTDIPGRAVSGALGAAVVASNGDDTGVVSWTYELLNTPPGSGIAPTTQGPGPTATFAFGSPDVPGSYRVRLTTEDGAGDTDVDIRNFCVPFPHNGLIAPPYQADPLPLPLTGSGAKPDEMNIAGQLFGWGGDDDATRKLLYQLLAQQPLISNGALDTPDATPAELVRITLPNNYRGPVEAIFTANKTSNPTVDYMTARILLVVDVSGGLVTIQSNDGAAPNLNGTAASTPWSIAPSVVALDLIFTATGEGSPVKWEGFLTARLRAS